LAQEIIFLNHCEKKLHSNTSIANCREKQSVK